MSETRWDMSRLTTGEWCALKRAAGTPGIECDAYRAFRKACTGCAGWEEDYLYACMCMRCVWRKEDEPIVLPFEECLRYLRSYNDVTDSMKKRIESVLEEPWDEDGFLLGKLYGLTRIIKSKTDCRPDFEKLASDLANWNNDNKRVQRRWLGAIYPFNDNSENNKEDARDVD